MLLLLSPAKSLDYETPLRDLPTTSPLFAAQAAELIERLREKTPQEIAGLMDLSDSLAGLNVARYQAWRRRATPGNSRPAALAFNGDVYEGLAAGELDDADLNWMQEHVCILSGLYGVLRPLDRLQPYRLEMGTRLENGRGRDLYAFWRHEIAPYLNRRLKASGSAVVINLASQEYFKAVDTRQLKARVIDCVFEEYRGGQYKIISFMAKRARGLMARFAVTQRLTEPEALQGFSTEGYAFVPAQSDANRWVFRRRQDA